MTSAKAFDSIVAKFGGTSATARAIGRSPAQVCQWRTRYGQFPATLYFTVQEALARIGVTRCPRAAFKFDKPRNRRAAAVATDQVAG